MDIFGPQLQGYQTDNPLKSMADVQTLYGNQQIQQKNALMLQQQQQEMQQTNALMQAVRQPGVINQETGEITPHGRNALMGVAPMVAPKLIQTMDLARQERTKSQVNELQAGMERLKINEAGSKALADAYTGMDEAYKAAVPTMGEQGARNYVNEQIRPDFEKKLKTGGLLPPEVTDKIGGTFDPEKNKIALAAATSHAERLKQQEAEQTGTTLISGKGTLYRVPKSGPVQTYYTPDNKWVPFEAPLPADVRPINAVSPENKIATAAGIAAATAPTKVDTAIKIAEGTAPFKAGATAGNLAPLGDTSLAGDAYLQSVPEQWRDSVKALSEGKRTPADFGRSSAIRAQLVSAAQHYNPSYSPALASSWKEFTTGTQGKNLININQALAHTGTMYDLAQEMQKAIGSGDVQLINRVLARVGVETGHPEVTNFEVARQAVGEELMRTFRQVGASEKEQEAWIERFGRFQSPDQLPGAMKTAAQLVLGRMKAVNAAWRNTGQKQDFPVVDEFNIPVVKKLGLDVPTSMMAGQKGSTPLGTATKESGSVYIEKRTTSDGRVLGKKADGTIEEVK